MSAALKWLDRRIARPGPHLALCLSPYQFLAAAKHHSIKQPGEWMNPGADATTHIWERTQSGEMTAVVCMRQWFDQGGVAIAGLLVHESVHVWQAYCDLIGENHPAREQEAYAIQNIAQELMADYVRQTGAD